MKGKTIKPVFIEQLMNANELAELIGHLENAKYVGASKAATMLRQQQAEIEALKLQLHTTLTSRDLRTYDGKLDMNNEPVAWIKQGRLGYPVLEFDKPFRYESYVVQNQPIPLYTHPAKTLTDEEIQPLLDRIQNYLELGGLFNPECMEHDKVRDLIMDCKAILRKAQEK